MLKSKESDQQLAMQVVYILLLLTDKYNFLPELLDVVGREKMMELLQLFAGITIKFPTIQEIERYSKEVTIFFRVHRSTKEQRASVVKDLADYYLVTEDAINLVYNKVKHLVEEDLYIPV